MLSSQKSEFLLGFLLLYNRRVSEILFFLSHLCEKKDDTIYTLWMEKQIHQASIMWFFGELGVLTACHFRSLKCSSRSLLLHLWMLKTFANQSYVHWASKKDTIKEGGWFRWLPGISQNFCGRDGNENTVLHGSYFFLLTLITRLFFLQLQSCFLPLFCRCNKWYNASGLSCALNESRPVGGVGNSNM